MAIRKSFHGYAVVVLKTGRKWKSKLVHRLVCEAFLGPIPDGMQVNHKNCKKMDSRLKNLEIVTPSENCRHSWAYRRRTKSYVPGVIQIKGWDMVEPICFSGEAKTIAGLKTRAAFDRWVERTKTKPLFLYNGLRAFAKADIEKMKAVRQLALAKD